MSILAKALQHERHKCAVWNKGHQVLGYDPDVFRKDDIGYWICYADYDNRQSEYGWQIDHIQPIALGGFDELANLRPLHWWANARLGGLLSGYLA